MPAAPLGLSAARRDTLARRVRLLVAATITYNLIEAGVALAAGAAASSTALIGFGLDSLIEVSSAAAVSWQFSATDHETREAREHTALRIITASFFALAAYITIDAGRALLGGHDAQPSTVGIVLAAVSLAVMPLLSLAQRRAGRELGSASVVSDSKQTLLCTYLSGVLLLGLIANSALGWSWADSVAALVIAAVAVKEGREAWRGESCCPPGPGAAAEADRTACVVTTGAPRFASRASVALKSVPTSTMSTNSPGVPEYRRNPIEWTDRAGSTAAPLGDEARPLAPLKDSDWPFLVAAAVLAGVVSGIALLAFVLLSQQDEESLWTPLFREILKTAYQALAVGALAGMAKLLLDRRKDKQAAVAELRALQLGHIAALVNAKHEAEEARLLVYGDRSVQAWDRATEQLLVPARISIRVTQHDLRDRNSAGEGVFDDLEEIDTCLENMFIYLTELTTEHSWYRQSLLAKETRLVTMDEEERAEHLSMANEMSELPRLGDLIWEGEDYQRFLSFYLDAHRRMRESLSSARGRRLLSSSKSGAGPSR